MSERANELPPGWRRDGDGVAFGPGPDRAEVREVYEPEAHRRLWTIRFAGCREIPRPRWFVSEGEAIARAVELTRPAQALGGVVLRDEDGGETPAERTAHKPWTPKDGERVRVAWGATEGVVEDEFPDDSGIVLVRVQGELVNVPHSWLRPHAEPAPDPRDAEIEQLHKEREAAMAEVSRLKDELAAKPAAALLSVEERDRLAKEAREVAFPDVPVSWEYVSPEAKERHRRAVDLVVRAIQPTPERIAEALKALERQEWIEEAKADLDYIPGTGWRLYARGLGGWTTSGHDTAAAAIDAVMEKHPLTREGE